MGLNHVDARGAKGLFAKDWLLPGLAAVIALSIALAGDSGREFLRYDRPAIGAGEVWRLLSGHFAHLGFSHLALNLAGLALVWILIADYLSRRQWLLIAVIVLAGIDLGFWLLQPQLMGYVGLSGLLHGLLAAGIVAGLGRGRPELLALAVVLVGKLAYEQLAGPLPGSETTTGGAVIVAAHAYGAIAGVIGGGIMRIRVRERAPI